MALIGECHDILFSIGYVSWLIAKKKKKTHNYTNLYKYEKQVNVCVRVWLLILAKKIEPSSDSDTPLRQVKTCYYFEVHFSTFDVQNKIAHNS